MNINVFIDNLNLLMQEKRQYLKDVEKKLIERNFIVDNKADLFCKETIPLLNNKEFKNFLLSNKTFDFRSLNYFLPYATYYAWEHLQKESTSQELLELFEGNSLFNTLGREQIEIIKNSLMKASPNCLNIKIDNNTSVLLNLLLEKRDITFIQEYKEEINALTQKDKKKLMANIVDCFYSTRENQVNDLLLIMLNIDEWYKYENTVSTIFKIPGRLSTKKNIAKFNSILGKNMDNKLFDYLNEKNIDLLTNFIEKNFCLSEKIIKLCINNQKNNNDNNHKIYPVLIGNEENLFNRDINKCYELLKNYFGVTNFIGTPKEQDVLIQSILDNPHDILYKRPTILFNHDGKTASDFLQVVRKISNEQDVSNKFKDFVCFLSIALEENIKEESIQDFYKRIEHLDLDFFNQIKHTSPGRMALHYTKKRDDIDLYFNTIKEKELINKEFENTNLERGASVSRKKRI